MAERLARQHCKRPSDQGSLTLHHQTKSISVVLVTGAASGLNIMTARALDQAGYTVYVSILGEAGRNTPPAGVADCVRREMFRNIELANLVSRCTSG